VIEARDFGNIRAANKGAAAGARKDRQPQVGIGSDGSHCRYDFFHQRGIEAVELGGIIDGKPYKAPALGPLFALDPKQVGADRHPVDPVEWTRFSPGQASEQDPHPRYLQPLHEDLFSRFLIAQPELIFVGSAKANSAFAAARAY
jgi:hypothetical protein